MFRVTAGNLRHNHLYIHGHHDFFPADCIGTSRKSTNGNGTTISILLTGLGNTIVTDIGSDAKTGKPRRFFRGRSWVRQFYEHHNIKTGDVLAMERLGQRRYRLYPFDAKTDRQEDWHEFLDTPPRGRGPTVLELFAGYGGMALGFSSSSARTRDRRYGGRESAFRQHSFFVALGI
ncbi:MAG: hypothetical protein KJ749_06080 [Planctomycetes bacterium]|nr:hypothetical protein [Planctomycetota bacterium]